MIIQSSPKKFTCQKQSPLKGNTSTNKNYCTIELNPATLIETYEFEHCTKQILQRHKELNRRVSCCLGETLTWRKADRSTREIKNWGEWWRASSP